MKRIQIVILLLLQFSIGNAQTKSKFHFEKIIFHTTRCFGTCPRIDLKIESNRSIYVDRELYSGRSTKDTYNSGQFKGTLSKTDYAKLVGLVERCHFDTLTFPDVQCCDGPIRTFIVYYNGKRKYLNSMEPAEITWDLIEFLESLARNTKLKKTKKIVLEGNDKSN